MLPRARVVPIAGPDPKPTGGGSAQPDGDARGNSVVQLHGQKPAQARMQDTLHAALQLVSRLCDRGLSERERTDCALRARGSLRLLEQILGELPVTLTALPAHRQQAANLEED